MLIVKKNPTASNNLPPPSDKLLLNMPRKTLVIALLYKPTIMHMIQSVTADIYHPTSKIHPTSSRIDTHYANQPVSKCKLR